MVTREHEKLIRRRNLCLLSVVCLVLCVNANFACATQAQPSENALLQSLKDEPAALYLFNTTKSTAPEFKYARCLDGSSAGFYFRPASTNLLPQATQWLIHLQGGGECVTKTSCTSRSKTDLGSSKNWRPTTRPGFLLNGNTEQNPNFSASNHIYIPYCSGDLFLGQDTEQNDRAYGLQFSGIHIVNATITYALDYLGMASATVIVISGDSAGGIGAVATADMIQDKIARYLQAQGRITIPRVVVAPIAGSYFNNYFAYEPKQPDDPKQIAYIPWSYNDLKRYQALWNAFVPERCAALRPSDPWACMFLSASLPSLNVPLFAIQAQSDAVVMPLHGGLPELWSQDPPRCGMTSLDTCPETAKRYIQKWTSTMIELLTQIIKPTPDIPVSSRSGVFFASCLTHTGFSPKGPRIQGYNFIQAFSEWLYNDNSQRIWFDNCGASPTGEPNLYCGSC